MCRAVLALDNPERGPGLAYAQPVLEGTDAAAIHPTVSGVRARRVVDPDARPDGGESLRDFYWRVAGFADDLTARLAGSAGPGTSRWSPTAARSGC